MDKSQIKEELKKMLIERLSLKISPEDIKDTMPLFENPDSEEISLGLDSVEALEIVVGIEDVFNVIVPEGEHIEEFYSVESLADFVIKLKEES